MIPLNSIHQELICQPVKPATHLSTVPLHTCHSPGAGILSIAKDMSPNDRAGLVMADVGIRFAGRYATKKGIKQRTIESVHGDLGKNGRFMCEHTSFGLLECLCMVVHFTVHSKKALHL